MKISFKKWNNLTCEFDILVWERECSEYSIDANGQVSIDGTKVGFVETEQGVITIRQTDSPDYESVYGLIKITS